MMEAMATGVPVVTTYVAGIPELAVDDVTAAVVPAANSQALASAIERLISDAALRERLIEAARRQVEQLHDERTTMPRFMRAIGI
jgi:glycosyltransferase involved in cell wall biosynthesis